MTSTERPVLSILCLTYNHERFLSQALDSFLAQCTNFNFEIVVGEDCSTDGTAAILADYAEKFPNIIKPLWSTVNLGMVGNMRRTQAACVGRYIAICEGDDYWTDPCKLQKQVDFLESNADYVLCFHDAFVLRGDVIDMRPQLGRRFRRNASASDLMGGWLISTLTVCYRNVLDSIPPEFDQVPLLDLCLWSLLGEHGKGAFLGEIKPAIYRVHNGGVISNKSEDRKRRMTMVTFSFISNYWDRRGDVGLARKAAFKAVYFGVGQFQLVSLIKFSPILFVMLMLMFVRLFLRITESKGDVKV